MKAQLIVVQGKPEGKIIPLRGPTFRIGRGEDCHLRPNNEMVSRAHSEFTITADQVIIRDLGSRNGTLVNNIPITAPVVLKDRDLVQIGPLTFAVAIQGAPAAAEKSARPAPAKAASPDDVSYDEIESWLGPDRAHPPDEPPSGVYGGDTITLSAMKDAPKVSGPAAPQAPAAHAPRPAAPAAPKPTAAPKARPPAPAASKPPAPAAPTSFGSGEFERLPGGRGDISGDQDGGDDLADAPTEEFIDESNPFYAKPKGPATPPKPKLDTSDAASDILKRLMERRKSK